jgi:hypothetical protein
MFAGWFDAEWLGGVQSVAAGAMEPKNGRHLGARLNRFKADGLYPDSHNPNGLGPPFKRLSAGAEPY